METCPKISMIAFDLKACNYESSDYTEKILHVNDSKFDMLNNILLFIIRYF